MKQQRRNPPTSLCAYVSCSADLCSQSLSSALDEYIYERIYLRIISSRIKHFVEAENILAI
jgi:hypothetical protein